MRREFTMVPYETPEIVTLGDARTLVRSGGCRTWEGSCVSGCERYTTSDGSILDDVDAD